ncbi:MAG: site-2 protease family protein [Longimicrobiales bacterium]
MASYSLGKILGFNVRLDASWFIIFFLLIWTFGTGVFPAVLPGRPEWVHLLMGVAAALLFFSSLLGHELSHSVVARAKGIPVRGITLFIFGGIAMTEREAETPGDEFQIAGAGPLASILISVLFFAVAFGLRRIDAPAAFGVVSIYLGELNLLLALFNLLPGFPLDGGRLFRAVVWKTTGSLERATRWAAAAGAGLGYLLMALGVFEALGGAMLNGLWLVFIGWFLRNAARAGAPTRRPVAGAGGEPFERRGPPGPADPEPRQDRQDPPLGREVGRQ